MRLQPVDCRWIAYPKIQTRLSYSVEENGLIVLSPRKVLTLMELKRTTSLDVNRLPRGDDDIRAFELVLPVKCGVFAIQASSGVLSR